MALRHALRGACALAGAPAAPSCLAAGAGARFSHSAAQAPQRQSALRGALTWLLRANLSPRERRALAEALHPPPPPPALRPPVVQTVEVVRTVVKEVLVPAPAPAEHPVLGQLLYDFGYKRVYAMRAATLTDPRVVPVWNLQRSFRLERAEAISRAKHHDASLGLPGVVTLYELPGGAPSASTAAAAGAAPPDSARFRAILDGQHRVGALRLLSRGAAAPASPASADAASSPWERVLVEVYPLASEAAAASLFTEINSAQPVLLVDLPPAAGGAPAADKGALEGAAGTLAARFPAMFKPSVACKAPHCNIDSLRDKLFQLDVMAAHELRSADSLLDWLLARNAALGALSEAGWAARRPARKSAAADATFAKALAKAREHGFYLGMDWRWVEE